MASYDNKALPNLGETSGLKNGAQYDVNVQYCRRYNVVAHLHK